MEDAYIHVKILLGNTYYRFNVESPADYPELKKAAASLPGGSGIILSYVDEDGDAIRLGNQMELDCACSLMYENMAKGGNEVKPPPQPSPKDPRGTDRIRPRVPAVGYGSLYLSMKTQ
ncbi:hypothetical protein Pelo_5033 [Pelomyxa schiedti]|nr:hypothetical protein Pelo_5033 [Pelomyxa schiedti]